MMRRARKILAVLALGLLAAPSCTWPKPGAQDDMTGIQTSQSSAPLAVLANAVPGDAILYIGWQGSENLRAQYAKSNLKHVIDASEIPAWISEKTEWLLDKIKKEEPEAEAPIRLALSISGKMWRHPTAFYLGPLDLSKMDKDTPPDVRIALVCQTGAESDALIAEVQPLIDLAAKEAAKDKDVPPLRIKKVGDLIVFTVGRFTVDQEAALGLGIAKHLPEVLNDNVAFRSAMREVDANAAVNFYIDATKVPPQLKEMFAKLPKPGAYEPDFQKLGPKIVDALGLNCFTQVAASGNFLGAEWSERGFVGLTPEKKGLAVFFDSKPLPEDYVKAVPKDAAWFMTLRLDMGRIYDELRAGIKSVDPDSLKEFDSMLGMLKRTMDLDIGQDIIAPLGDTWLIYRLAESEATESGYVLMVDLKDEKKFAATLTAVEDILRERGMPLPEEKSKVAGVDAMTVGLPQMELAWGVYKGKFILGTTESFTVAVKQLKSPKTSILDNPNYVAVRKSLGGGLPVALDYHEPARTYPGFAQQMAYLMLVANTFGAELPPNLLPDPDKIEKYLTPGGGVSWVDAKGYHSASRSAFPGATLISGEAKSGQVVTAVQK